jgi:hypothetical protein
MEKKRRKRDLKGSDDEEEVVKVANGVKMSNRDGGSERGAIDLDSDGDVDDLIPSNSAAAQAGTRGGAGSDSDDSDLVLLPPPISAAKATSSSSRPPSSSTATSPTSGSAAFLSRSPASSPEQSAPSATQSAPAGITGEVLRLTLRVCFLPSSLSPHFCWQTRIRLCVRPLLTLLFVTFCFPLLLSFLAFLS